MKIYIAAPFFNDEQKATVEAIEATCEEFGLEYYSPMRVGILKPDDSQEERKRILQSNIDNINKCDVMIAVWDDKDSGTIFEWGYAHCAGIPVVAYTAHKGRGMNVMLANTCIAFCCGTDMLANALADMILGQNMDRHAYTGPVF